MQCDNRFCAQRLATMGTFAAMRACLLSIPEVGLTEEDTHALSVLGSLQQLAQCSVEDVLACTGLTEAQAQRLCEFLQTGC